MRGMQLLIADDDKALGALLEEYLAEAGYSITLCSRGDDAIAAMQKKHFDIVLTDIVMPGADGLTVLAAAKADSHETLVLLMTGYSGIEDAIHAVGQGAYDFISKPFQLPELRVRLDNAARFQSLLRRWKALSTQSVADAASDMFVPFQTRSTADTRHGSAAIRAYGLKGNDYD